ncbi:hypothetical protein B0H19DRAFT_1258101 [Mycena capillaripes]|nr:hypothetical protein B0H19DRAFT_1258101 [Mycena capillaripes]
MSPVTSIVHWVHEHELLPSPFLPIAKLLDFRLPLQNVTVTAPQPAQYFSAVAPDIDDAALMLRVRHLAIPDAKTVNKLLTSSRQCWLDGVQSVVYSHLGGVVGGAQRRQFSRLTTQTRWLCMHV